MNFSHCQCPSSAPMSFPLNRCHEPSLLRSATAKRSASGSLARMRLAPTSSAVLVASANAPCAARSPHAQTRRHTWHGTAQRVPTDLAFLWVGQRHGGEGGVRRDLGCDRDGWRQVKGLEHPLDPGVADSVHGGVHNGQLHGGVGALVAAQA